MNENTNPPAAEDHRVHDHGPYRGPGPDGRCHERVVDGRLRGECKAAAAPAGEMEPDEPVSLSDAVKAAIVNVAEKANVTPPPGSPGASPPISAHARCSRCQNSSRSSHHRPHSPREHS